MTRAPATAPLWAMGVAMAMALDQWWPGSPGMFEGKRSVTVGTFHEMSPMSSEPPLLRFGGLAQLGRATVARPRGSRPTSAAPPGQLLVGLVPLGEAHRADVLVHRFGDGRLKWRGHAAALTR
jgi:hypothetical protein